jgi:phosphatidylethanolamine/phosphatidyl-N-methylethanolamine N-methyltransferase
MKDSAFTAAVYDYFMTAFDILIIKNWRRRLISRLSGTHVLEAGVGTGLNLPHYSAGQQVTALDISGHFLDRARRRAETGPAEVEIVQGDVHNLPFGESTFDSALTSFLFCQAADPLLGLQEMKRVLKPGGQLLLLEHVQPEGKIGRLVTAISKPLYRLTGEHIARDTAALVTRAGFKLISVDHVFTSAILIIEAEK